VTGVSRFRLFGRPAAAPAPPPLRLGAPPRAGAPAPWGPSTTLFGDAGRGRRPTDDPDTDPQGFRTIAPAISAFPQFPLGTSDPADDPMDAPTVVTARPAPPPALPLFPAPRTPPAGAPSGVLFDTSPDPSPDPAESAALAGAFAADYLSWDEDDPQRRGRVLVDYLASPGTDPTHLGWAGRGRQRAEFALPGRVRSDGDGRTLVDVRVRVTPYRRTGAPAASPTPEWAETPETAGIPAVAPAPHARGWEALGSYWIRLSVPVVRSGGRLAVDAWEENLGEELEEARPAAAAPPDAEAAVDPCLADDVVVAPFGTRR
jgi:hypothetical protein